MPISHINGHDMYWELHGEGEQTLVCMGGWGTFCRERKKDAPRIVFDRYRVLLFDYRGIGESTDSDDTPTTKLYASDVAALCDELGIDRIHVLGMVGMGACVGQELAIARPDLVMSLVMTGTWAKPDPTLADQLRLFADVHLKMGFEAFQLLAAAYSFDPGFYNQHRDRILGPDGAWGDLNGRADAHARLVEACMTHDTLGRLDQITCPTFVVHAGADPITGVRTTTPLEEGIPGAEAYNWPDLAHIIAGRENKVRFDELIGDFLGRVDAKEATRS